MENAAEKTVTLVVYYTSTQPIATLELNAQDEHLSWLMDSMEVIPCGKYYCLRLSTSGEFRQARRIFPAIGQVNRHVRFRAFLRKKATKRPATSPVEATGQAAPLPSPMASIVAPAGFRFTWMKSFFKLTLNGL
ncbi:hypothetical protein ACFSC6_03965 [Rufibacter sediminis]|uniref:Uncharacterized protein n=1 Tax=Rufibacter sediminis TaxID=2762756 RepID=A0ABR6VVK3_9BACT|nr:hypothetical protein [Rufibacter sediminis]MBC3541225.1 hypothetical protein [Rufibacter sediminis]